MSMKQQCQCYIKFCSLSAAVLAVKEMPVGLRLVSYMVGVKVYLSVDQVVIRISSPYHF